MADYRKLLSGAIAKSAKGISRGEIEEMLEVPPNPELGDLAFPCFKLAAVYKKAPAEIAQELVNGIKLPVEFEKMELAGGYLNFYLNKGSLGKEVIGEILKQKEKYGSSPKKKEKIVTEFCHANTHKAFHIGHVRNISLGAAISRILEFNGYKIYRTNYQGDVGPHVSKCLWGYMNGLGGNEPKEGKGIWLGKIYATASGKVKGNEELGQEMRDLTKKLFEGKDKKLQALWKKTRKWSLDYFMGIYRDFGVKFDRLYFESEMEKRGQEIAKGLLKKGVAEESENAIIMDLKKYGLGVLVILKSDDMPLYSTKDLALAEMKFREFKPDRSLHIVGAEQDFYFRQLIKTLNLAGFKEAKKTRHISYALVVLEEGKMASREGKVITYNELMENMMEQVVREVGERHKGWNAKRINGNAKAISLAAIKFSMLNRDNNKEIVFNWKRALALEGETGPYLQYSYARARSILRKVKDSGKGDYSLLTEGMEKNLVSHLGKFPAICDYSAEHVSPLPLCQHLLQMGAAFNSFYHELPVLKAEKKFRNARIGLVRAFSHAMKNGMELLGIPVLEEM
ncbi:MAG: arginine--tRNA ligase [Candidatus Diapherotrites archaeon]